MLFRETVAVYCENHMEQINTLYGQNARVFLTCIRILVPKISFFNYTSKLQIKNYRVFSCFLASESISCWMVWCCNTDKDGGHIPDEERVYLLFMYLNLYPLFKIVLEL
jgi:hypothetical protein